MYLGSVRFFKHLILIAIALLVAIPTLLCIILSTKNQEYAVDAAAMVEQNTQMKFALEDAQTKLDSMMEMNADSDTGSDVRSLPPWEHPAYWDLYPELYVNLETDGVGNGTESVENTCYLTFDDGPSRRTPEVLRILKEYQVKATFFVVGKSDEQAKEWMRQIVSEGHTLAIHSYAHEYKKVYASVESFLEDFNKMFELIKDATGVTPTIFRFPGGSINNYNNGIYQEIIGEMLRRGFLYYDWNVSAEDAASHVTENSILKQAGSNVERYRRAMILMHDSEPRELTVKALPRLIEIYQNAGFTLLPLTPKVTPITFSYPFDP